MESELSYPIASMGMVMATPLSHWLGDALGQVPSSLIPPRSLASSDQRKPSGIETQALTIVLGTF